MKYKTFLDILLLIALLSTVVIMTIDNVEATPNYEYEVTIIMYGNARCFSAPTTLEALRGHANINGYQLRVNRTLMYTWWCFCRVGRRNVFRFNVNHSINTIYLGYSSGIDRRWLPPCCDDITGHYLYRVTRVVLASFQIHKNNTLVASGSGLGTHIINLTYPCPCPCPSISLPPPPIFELPPPPVLTPPVTRPEFFNFTALDSFFDFVDALFLPFAQIILNILWIFLGILDFINNTLITFWAFYDAHVIYEDFFNVLGFAYMFFEIPEIMTIMIFGLVLIIIKIYLKR